MAVKMETATKFETLTQHSDRGGKGTVVLLYQQQDKLSTHGSVSGGRNMLQHPLPMFFHVQRFIVAVCLPTSTARQQHHTITPTQSTHTMKLYNGLCWQQE